MSIYVDIKKSFEDFTLDISFECGDTALGLLGASGSGKSMTLRCIAGVVRPDSGEIVCNGKTLFHSKKKIDLPARKRNVGLLFQSYALFPNMTVWQNIAAGVRQKELRTKKVMEYLELLRLQGLEERFPRQLSGGQQQRVAIARMMAAEPEMLMLDEPFSALDRHLRVTIEEEFTQALERFQGTVLYVSHNVGEIYQYCADTLVLAQGRIAERGPTPDLFQSPTTVEAAQLTGCKNISMVEPSMEGYFSKEWNCLLQTPRASGICAVGVREGGMCLTESGVGGILVKLVHVRSVPHYDVLHLMPRGARRGLTCTCERARTPYYQELSQKGTLYLHFEPGALLPLSKTQLNNIK